MLMSTNFFMKNLVGRLNEEDRRDLRELNKATIDSQEDIVKSMNCLREATVYMDDVLHNPKVVKNLQYRMWVQTLDSFLSEMKSMVSYKTEPGQYEIDILELLIMRLSLLRIREQVTEQSVVRTSLAEMVKSVFSLNKRQRNRLSGR